MGRRRRRHDERGELERRVPATGAQASRGSHATHERPAPDPALLERADGGSRVDAALALQRTAGNRAVSARVAAVTAMPAARSANVSAGRRVVSTHFASFTTRAAPTGVADIRSETKDFSFARTQTLLEEEPPLFRISGTDAVAGGFIAKVRPERTRPPDHRVDVPGEGMHDLGPYGKAGRRLVSVDHTWAGKFRVGEQEHVDDTTLAWEATWKVVVDAINAVAKDPGKPAKTADEATKGAWARVAALLPAWLRPRDATEGAQRAVWTATKGAKTNVRRMISASGRYRDDQGWHTPAKVARDAASKTDLVEDLQDGGSKIDQVKAREVIDLAIKELKPPE
jgi:hypothetical protein